MNRSPEAGATLNDWLGYLEQQHHSPIDMGLDRVLLVFRRLLPMNWRPRVITVAGTNGKGSTVRWLQRMLQFQGRTSGAYLSPHIDRFNERVLLNGTEATDQDLICAFTQVEQARGSISLTYFEVATLAALWLFHRDQVQDLVLEVGLGGRLDAVNILDPALAIITSIGLDHTDWLGDDLESIGYEKAGILRPGIAAIYGETNPPRSVLQQVAAQKVQLCRWGIDFARESDTDPMELDLHSPAGKSLALTWPGNQPPATALVVALQALCLLGQLPDQPLLEHLSHCPALPGRFEQLGKNPTIIADVGHNPHGAAWLSAELARRYPSQPVVAVYGALADKDAAGVALALKETVSHWYLAPLEGSRGRSGESLQTTITRVLSPATTTPCLSVAEALEQAVARAGTKGLVLVFGSFLTVAAARQCLLTQRGTGGKALV
ncbi:MAG: bifunctional folylpolyglutamate synthase/dihydrofolate synthase [Halomonadaceae bacterium]|nr:MAG: bifunctional folylpolyglutamate synthase/dihydrofolate synthase [Halomonadaceae bacterium]